MEISVIIPVYNADKFIETAVESALKQEETAEVLLIEDNSPDDSLRICTELERQYEKVKLFRHPDGQNKGAGATRNLGIRKAACEYIAFLDADDYYLPNRFRTAKKRLEKDKNLDGVYEAIGMHFYDPMAKQQWLSRGYGLVTSIHMPVPPNRLFETLIKGKNGYIHLDGLVVKRNLFDACGYFPEHLRLHQDTAVILQLAAFGMLAPGNLKTPVALRGIHADNRITQNPKPEETMVLLWETLLAWAFKKHLNLKKKVLIYNRHIFESYHLKKKMSPRFSKIDRSKYLYHEGMKHPVLFIGAAAISLFQKFFSGLLRNRYRVMI